MIQKVLSFVEQHHMIDRGDHILAGVSGGADSVCLLLILVRLRETLGCTVTTVHVEHGIRGEDSLKDAEFVGKLCERLGVDCHVYHCDAVAFSGEKGMTLEEGARELRYRYFEQLQKQLSADKIAVAHNQNDCGETLLFHLARGTGLRGMCGIVPVRDNIIRPLLCLSRKEIEAFLRKEGQGFCLDMSNFTMEYSRNKIRHQVLPVLEEINEGAIEHLYQSTEYMAEALELAEGLTEAARASCVAVSVKEPCVAEATGETGTAAFSEKPCAAAQQEKEFLLKEQLTEQPGLIRRMLILELLGECAGSRKDISRVHVEQVLGLFEHQVGRKIILPYGMTAQRTYGGIRIWKCGGRETLSAGNGNRREPEEASAGNGNQKEPRMPAVQELKPGMRLEIPGSGLGISACILEKTKEIHEIPQKKYTKWFDYDKIKGTLLLRNRCQGDYFIMDSQGRRQSLKKYFINEKVPAEEREKIPVLAEGSHILWAVGYRISEAYKVTENTERILEIQVNGGCIHE